MRHRRSPVFISLLLLALMAVQLVQVASFEVQRAVLRSEMKQRIRQGLPSHELVHFTFSPAGYEALEKEDGGREFRVDGHLYDVVRRSTGPDGNIHVEAVDDRMESRLMAGLNDLLRSGLARKGMGRERARALIGALASALPLAPIRVHACHVAISRSHPERGVDVLEGTTLDLLRPPRS